MKKIWLKVLCGIILVIWAVRYITLNDGHILSYPQYPITYYKLNEEAPYGKNITYYGDENNNLDGYSMQITDSELATHEEFASRYGKFDDQKGMINRPFYLIVDTVFANYGDSIGVIDIQTLILHGIDWWNYCSYGQTLLVNSEIENRSLYDTGTIKLSMGERMEFKLVFGIEPYFLTTDRWHDFHNETIWITQTIMPEEHRLLIQ